MFEIPFSGASIGSIQTNNIVISNPSISRNHAKFIFEDNDIFIIDNNSTNGTLVEGTQVKPDVKNIVYNGSIIMLGNESFQLIVK
jgi:pSer/pThr/pTyr-binding forkhead associated (FHA) protein